MQENELQEVKKAVRDVVLTAIEEKLKPLEKLINEVGNKTDSIQKVVDLTESETSQDRKDFGDMKILQQNISAQFDDFRGMMSQLVEKIGIKVERKVGEAIDTVSEQVTKNVQPSVKKTLTDFVATKKAKLEPVKRFWLFDKIRRIFITETK